jgi:hypothetical protein
VWPLGTAESKGLQHGQLIEYFKNKNVIFHAQLNSAANKVKLPK